MVRLAGKWCAVVVSSKKVVVKKGIHCSRSPRGHIAPYRTTLSGSLADASTTARKDFPFSHVA
ncbi:hypothetical protein D1614_04285 [Maribellus luteus]|uniref:Uncharacterized protein n=1 Tax=Maribellus luteus TaxID=2305463 RepID=A0A399T2B3_9BACT|nr:hypothetical protein D1614_04285 [Maribellus luteus]